MHLTYAVILRQLLTTSLIFFFTIFIKSYNAGNILLLLLLNIFFSLKKLKLVFFQNFYLILSSNFENV